MNMIFMNTTMETILYIKATVVSVCLSVRAVPGHYPDKQTDAAMVCFVEGGGGGGGLTTSIKDLNRDSKYPVQTSRRT